MKRLLSAILLASMLMGLTACNGGEGADTTDASATETSETTELTADIPEDAFYENYTFTILARGGKDSPTNWANDDLVVSDEEARGDVVYKAVYDRNLRVSELLGIEIVQEEVIGSSKLRTQAQNIIMSDEDVYDVIMPSITDAATMAQDGYFVPLSELPYMDLSKPWYDQRCIEQLAINGDNYFFFSDITIRNLDAIWIYVFNKQLIDQFGLEDPYDLVEDGTWTMDAMTEMCKAATVPDGDNDFDKEDKWGLVGHDYVITASYVGSGERIATANSDGEISLTMNNERIYDVIEAVNGLRNYWIRYALTSKKYVDAKPFGFEPSDNYAELTSVFTEGNALFMGECMAVIEDMRSSNVEFGIVPSPKLNEEQDEYYSAVNFIAACMCIPKTARDLERTSIIIEALAAESHDTLIPAYYETAIKGKYTRDIMSSDMLDLIRDSVSYDLGIYYNWGELSDRFCALVYNGGDGFASMYASNEQAAQGALDSFLSSLE